MIIDYSLYLIADDSLCSPDTLIPVTLNAVKNGVTCVQLRMKKTPWEDMISLGKTLSALLAAKHIPLIINDHMEIAKLINATGLHIGQTDISHINARDYLGPHKIIGLSIENNEQAKRAQHLAVDYVSIGPIFQTTTKLDAAPPVGLAALKDMVPLFAQPVLAIGGINENNITAVFETGVSGVAIASAILSATEPNLSTKRLAQLARST